ncbi:Bug family tripartite tricarboxylate transporter substrate binding protein [Variovorax sp. DT-64]|uniref:Bug family tripartite tricarboxylate transporter substrate binding protein n=1 Tax=Variovorax sp. DT-64 TaxID=3396160 RepID=UPI003F1D09B4
MKTTRRFFGAAAIAALYTLGGPASTAWAQDASDFPARPIKIMLGFPPGGSTDSPMRVLAEDASKILKQPVVIENKPGAAGLMPAQLLQGAQPDGYTVGVIPANLFRLPYTGNINWNPATDLRYVIGLTSFVYGIVVPASSQIKTMDDYVAYAKAHPGELTYATPGAYLAQHLAMEQVARIKNIKLSHVPYKGTAESLQAVVGEHVMSAAETSGWGPYVESGKLRLLVTFGEKRMSRFPDVPTLKEVGIDIPPPSAAWGLAVPKNTPAAVVAKLHDAFKQAMEQPAFRNALAQYYMEPVYMSSARYQQFAAESTQREKQLLEAIGFVREK